MINNEIKNNYTKSKWFIMSCGFSSSNINLFLLKAFDDFNNKQQKYTFFDMKKYVYSENVFNTLR